MKRTQYFKWGLTAFLTICAVLVFYDTFYQALISAETAELHAFETPRVFEGCMPVEVMAKKA